ncbi:hypothetical protein L1987_67008 [Smallanthus sonchifolius]|uniref:Uncharacterized protein n=1 Tax=Smallanthus sonchifolius TaxID=185202 RepID=A0ACB9BZ51_9ASTR|nr:hypothetical protein L1987_67008 [Smallanthus sonchifolius]
MMEMGMMELWKWDYIGSTADVMILDLLDMFPLADTINGVQVGDEIGKATIGEHLARLPIIIDDEIEASLSSADSVHVLLKQALPANDCLFRQDENVKYLIQDQNF